MGLLMLIAAHGAAGWLPDCRNKGLTMLMMLGACFGTAGTWLLMLIDARGAGGWLPDCRNKGLMMLMMFGAGFEIAGTWGC